MHNDTSPPPNNIFILIINALTKGAREKPSLTGDENKEITPVNKQNRLRICHF